MIQNTWSSSLSPGNEQLFRWSAAAAKTPGTYNFAGVENPAADAMIQAMLAAQDRGRISSPPCARSTACCCRATT